MKNKIKEVAYSVLIVVAVIMLGLAPSGERTVLALRWGTLGIKLSEAGVIDESKFADFYDGEYLEINSENSKIALNTLWALGLANKNPILEKGPMMDPRYGGAGNFASTGGWTLAEGDAMAHYSMHQLINLTPEQQELVENTTKNIFRPCCANPAYFPDCNHGMAMLGLMELMAAQGATEDEMYKTAEDVNALWFPKVEASCAA
jgi:hypothetical protein